MIQIKEILGIFKKKDDVVCELPIENRSINSLAPKVLVGSSLNKVMPYLDKLKEAIDEKGVNNIALMGNYGSGKSTIIKTFQHYNSHYEYLNISLASFSEPKATVRPLKGKVDIRNSKEEIDRLLEVSILQQIFYHVKPSEIPNSRFKRIIELSIRERINKGGLFVIWLISAVLTIKYNYLNKINPTTWDIDRSIDLIAILVLLVVFGGLGYGFVCVIEVLGNSKITKVNIKGEIELGDNVNKSILNEHLDEILYFFERTKYNVVIIEDLDRFESTSIFTKLREINIILNNSESIGGRGVKFVYAVGDFLFNDKKERVKFFEYIIPIIPFINASNAEGKLKDLIRESELEENIFSQNFIADVVAFIDDIDMRLLINIFHEFVVYRGMLNPFVKNNEELFAIIIYKNLYPNDFSDLNKKRGELYKLIKNKPHYIEQLTVEIDNKIIENRGKIKQIQDEPKETIEELQALYIMKIISKAADGVSVDKKDLTQDFSNIIDGNIIRYKDVHGRLGSYRYNFSDIENEVNPKQTYKERAELIKRKLSNKLKSLKEEVSDLQTRKHEIENWDLKEIFNMTDITPHINKHLDTGLFRNLILNGYINENYFDYMTLFHEGGSLTQGDMIFERNVRGGYRTKPDHELTEIRILVGKISDKYFKRDVILNFSLMDFLGENYEQYSSKYISIIKLLGNDKDRSVNFIDQYIKREGSILGVFIRELTVNWSGFWYYIYCESGYTDEKKKDYLRLIFLNSSIKNILDNQNTVVLKESISETQIFQSLVEEFDENNYTKSMELIYELEILFISLVPPTEKTKDFFKYVYEQDHYQLNIENVNLILNEYGEDITEVDFKKRNYTAIITSGLEPLISFVESNINDYVENIFLKLPNNKKEEEINLIKLLNNKDLREDLKFKIIIVTETIIANLNKVKKRQIKEELLKNSKIVAKWDNVVDYYNTVENKLNSNLIAYLNREDVYEKLGSEKMIHVSEEFDYPEFRKNILLCDGLSIDCYTTLLNKSPYVWSDLPVEDINEDKVEYLVDNVLTTTKNNYRRLKENYGNYHIKLIENDFNAFISNTDDFETNVDDVILLLKSNKINDKGKLNYIPFVDQQIISESKVVCELISKLIVNNVAKIGLEYLVFESIVLNTTSIENNVKIINLNINLFDDSQLRALVSRVNSKYKRVFEERKRTTFDKTNYNEELFMALKNRNLISNVFSKSGKFMVVGKY